jgi:hypothetical protein
MNKSTSPNTTTFVKNRALGDLPAFKHNNAIQHWRKEYVYMRHTLGDICVVRVIMRW